MSKTDIDKGGRWFSEVEQHLALANVGLICLTPENLAEPWLLFEAGSLSRLPHLCPVLFDLAADDIPSPLKHYQTIQLTLDDILLFIRTCNTILGNNALSEVHLQDAVEVWWPRLAATVQSIDTLSWEEALVHRREESFASKIFDRLDRLMERGQSQDTPTSNEAMRKRLLDLGDRLLSGGDLNPETAWRLAQVLLLIRADNFDLRKELDDLLGPDGD